MAPAAAADRCSRVRLAGRGRYPRRRRLDRNGHFTTSRRRDGQDRCRAGEGRPGEACRRARVCSVYRTEPQQRQRARATFPNLQAAASGQRKRNLLSITMHSARTCGGDYCLQTHTTHRQVRCTTVNSERRRLSLLSAATRKCGLYRRSDSILVTNYVSSIIMNKTNTLLYSRFRENRSYSKSLLTRSLSIRFIQSNSQNVNKATGDSRLCPGYAI